MSSYHDNLMKPQHTVQIQEMIKTIYNLHAILKSHLIQWPLHIHIALLTYETGACLLSG